MKKLILTVLCIICCVGTFALVACKAPVIDFNTKIDKEGAVEDSSLVASDIFFEAVKNSNACPNYRRETTLQFQTNIGGNGQTAKADSYIVDGKVMRYERVLGSGGIASKNTGINLFYFDGSKGYTASNTGKNKIDEIDAPDHSIIADSKVEMESAAATKKATDERRIFSYDFTKEKLADNTDETVLVKTENEVTYYFLNVNMDMDVGTKDPEIQRAVNEAIEGGTGCTEDTVTWTIDTRFNSVIIEIDGDYYLFYVEMLEDYEAMNSIVKTGCTQSNSIQFFYSAKDYTMPSELLAYFN